MNQTSILNSNYKTADEGWIYCICNFRDREQVKIGMTLNMERRLDEANNSFVSEGFYIVIAKFVTSPYRKEQVIHQIFHEHRVNPKREFFSVLQRGVFKKILQVFDLLDGRVHPLSKKSLTYRNYSLNSSNNETNSVVPDEPVGDTTTTTSSPVVTKFAEELKIHNTQRFKDVFLREFKLTNSDNDKTRLDTIEQIMKLNDVHGDVVVHMQGLQKFPVLTKNGHVYTGVVRKTRLTSVSFADFEYDPYDGL
jgi:hypothetical protein